MVMLAAAAIAAGILPPCSGRRQDVNKQLKTCVSLPYRMVTIF